MHALVVMSLALVVAGIATTLVLHRDYEDGLFGRIGLSFIALACSARAMQIVARAIEAWQAGESPEYRLNPANALLLFGLAIFLSRHLYRFLRWRRLAEARGELGAGLAGTCGKR